MSTGCPTSAVRIAWPKTTVSHAAIGGAYGYEIPPRLDAWLQFGPRYRMPVDSLFSDESVKPSRRAVVHADAAHEWYGWSEAAEYGPAPLKSPLYGLRKDLIGKLAAYRERYVPNNVLNRAKRFFV